MAVVMKTLYDTDFVEWSAQMAELIRTGRLDEVDLEHVAEEIEDLGKSDRQAVWSQLTRLLQHRIKQQIQPERAGRSWASSIASAQIAIGRALKESLSLRRYLVDELQDAYDAAVRLAKIETGVSAELPKKCPYTLDELLSP